MRRSGIQVARGARAAVAGATMLGLAAGAVRAFQAAPPTSPAPGAAPPAAASPAAASDAGRRPVFTSDVDVVAVDVNVVDKRGRPLRGLAVEDFTVTVDGTPRRLVSADFVTQGAEEDAQPAPPPSPDRVFSTNEGLRRGRIVIVVVDQGNIRPGVGRHALRAADRLLDALNPSDLVALVTMPGGGPQVDLTTEHTRVRNALQRITGRAQYGSRRISLAEAQAFEDRRPGLFDRVVDRECPVSMGPFRDACIAEVEGEAFSVAASFHHQSEVSMKGLGGLMESLQQVEGPKTVVLITEGLHSERTDELRAVANAAAAARVAFFGIHIDERGMADPSRAEALTTPVEDFDLVNRDLFRLSSLTRGAVFSTTGSAMPFQRIAREISAYYLLGFEPQPADRDGKDHTIDVAVRRPDATVRARRALPFDTPRLDPREVLAGMMRSALPAVELPLRVTTYASRDAGTGKVRVVVSAEVGRGATAAAGLGVGFALVDEKGRVAASSFQRVDEEATGGGDGPVAYLGSAAVDPGRYTLKLAAVDARGRRGSVEHPVKAALTTLGPLEVSDLLVAPPAARPAMSLRPAVDATSDAGAIVGLVDLYGTDASALKSATVAMEVAADETAPALVSAPARLSEATDGQRSAQGAVSLSLVPPGRYVARAVVSVGGRPAGQVTRPFTISPSRAGTRPGGQGGLAASGPRFDRRLVLDPEVVARVLDELATTAGAPSPAVARAAAQARQGRLETLSDLLSAGEPPSAGLAFLRGLGLFARGEMVAAGDQFRATLRLRPDFAPALLYLGASSAALGRDQDAAGAWNQALLADARSPLLSLLLGDALVRRGEVDAALDVFREASATWPSDDRFRHRLGLALAAGSRPAEALPLLTTYLDKHPADVEALFATVRLMYEAVTTQGTDREPFLRYARAYLTAAGPQQALVAQWIRAVEGAP
jgi:VWFA-related protein